MNLKERRKQLEKDLEQTEKAMRRLDQQKEQAQSSYQQIRGALAIIDEQLQEQEKENKSSKKPVTKEDKQK